MECPKCRHKIYLELTLEDLVFCPYCDQRMVPPKDFNLCPVCSGELPPGAEFCLKCGEKLVPDETVVINHAPTEPHEFIREDVAAIVNNDPPAVQEPEPPRIQEDNPDAYRPPADYYREEIPVQQISQEPPAVEQVPEPELLTPQEEMSRPFAEQEPLVIQPQERHLMTEPEPVSSEIVEEELHFNRPPDKTNQHAIEKVELPAYESSSAASAEPQPHVIPVEEKTLPVEPTSSNSEFSFCIACGLKLPSGALFCPRCGKNTLLPESLGLQVRVLKAQENFPDINEKTAPVPPPYVHPKYRPVTSREPIYNAMQDVAPSLPHHPKASASAGWSIKNVWLKFRRWLSRAAVSVWDFIKTRQKWFHRVLGKLSEEREITPVDLTSAEALIHASKSTKTPAQRHIPRGYLILIVITYITIFVIISFTIIRCTA